MHISSAVTAIAPAPREAALEHFESSLRFETDCWDVHHALVDKGQPDFVLLCAQPDALRGRAHTGRNQSPARQNHRIEAHVIRGQHHLRDVLRGPALQRRDARRDPFGEAGPAGESNDRRNHGLARRRLCADGRSQCPNTFAGATDQPASIAANSRVRASLAGIIGARNSPAIRPSAASPALTGAGFGSDANARISGANS